MRQTSGFILQVFYSKINLFVLFCMGLALLINGRVEYGLKLLGHKEVPEPKGTHIVRDAIHAIRFQLQVETDLAITFSLLLLCKN